VTGGVTEALAGPDAAIWHQEADLSDPGAPSRFIESAAAISRFLDILRGHYARAPQAPGRVAQRTSAESPAVHEVKLAARRHAHAV
jgi:hypothetical protein